MTIEERFAKLVQLVQRDMEGFKATIVAQDARIRALEQQHAALMGKQPSAQADAEPMVRHPITGRPVRMSEVDPKLMASMQFSEDDE